MGLLDFIIGRRKKTPVTQPSGTTGVPAYGGTLISFENAPDLQGRNLYRTLTNMVANTAIVGTGVRYYQNLIGGTSWSIEPKEGTGSEGQRAADLVRDGMVDATMPDQWSTCIKRASLYRMYGFSAHEWTMRRRSDGKMVFASIEHRPQSTIEFWDIPDRGGQLRGIVQRPLLVGGSDYYYVPRERLFYCVDNSLTDSPDGVGLLRHVVEHSRRLARYEQVEGFGYETDLRGIPVARVPYAELRKTGKGESWVAEQTKAIRDFVANHIKNPWQGLTIDSSPYSASNGNGGVDYSTTPQWALELLKGDPTGLSDVNVVIERLNREIARAMGMEFLLLGGDGKGSLALSRDKTSMFASILESSLHELAWFTVHDLATPLLALNGIDPEKFMPQIMPDPIATERIEVAVDALSKLAQAGAVLMPDDPAIDQIRRRLHLAEQPKLPPELLGTLARPRLPFGPGGTQPPDGKPAPGGAESKPAPKPGQKPTEKSVTFRRTEDDYTTEPVYLKSDDGFMRVSNEEYLRGIGDLTVREVERHADIAMGAKMIRVEMVGKTVGYSVFGSDGASRIAGPYHTRSEAVARLRLAERFK